jgi:hypothetical protein
MIQLAIILKESAPLLEVISSLQETDINFEQLDPQPGVSQIAMDMGLNRTLHDKSQSIVILQLPTLERIKKRLIKALRFIELFSSAVDFILLPQSAQALELSDFINRIESFDECPEITFIQLIESQDKLYTLGLEVWKKPDIMMNSQEDAESMITQIAELSLGEGLMEKEKVEFESGIYKVVKVSSEIQPEGLRNTLGIFRMIKQI